MNVILYPVRRLSLYADMTFVLFTGSSASGGSQRQGVQKNNGKTAERVSPSPGGSGGSGSEVGSTVSARQLPGGVPPPDRSLPPPPRDLSASNQELSASRQSFRMAMGNPCEFFVDIL